jgi:hypothetical protein
VESKFHLDLLSLYELGLSIYTSKNEDQGDKTGLFWG